MTLLGCNNCRRTTTTFVEQLLLLHLCVVVVVVFIFFYGLHCVNTTMATNNTNTNRQTSVTHNALHFFAFIRVYACVCVCVSVLKRPFEIIVVFGFSPSTLPVDIRVAKPKNCGGQCGSSGPVVLPLFPLSLTNPSRAPLLCSAH